jgi:acetyl-CoA C-acetyltransferase
MREVAILGIGQTKVDEQWDSSLRVLAGDACFVAMQDAGMEHVDAVYTGNMMSGSANKQLHLGAYIADWIGMRYSAGLHIEAACSSGAAAFRSGLMAVASGLIETAIVVGVEKMTDSPGDEITAALATAADADWEVDQGLSFVALNALVMQRYMHEFHWNKNEFAAFSINAHANASHNPFARFQEPITQKDYERASMVCDPINLMDASPMGDGAAAAVLVPLERIKRQTNVPVITVAASAAATDSIAVHNRLEPTWLQAAQLSANSAYTQAGIKPDDIDLFELHDAFSIMAALSLEACGFTERGKGPRLALDDEIKPAGRIPIATRGGLKARGHPVGATGMYQIVELVQQLRGQCGETQVPGAEIGMAQNIGGSGSNIITHILKRI